MSKSVLPAWQLLADGLEQLSDTGRTRGGLSQKPDGRQYYAWLVKESTGSSLSMDQLYLLLQKQFQKTYKEMKQTLTTYQELTGGTPDLAPVNDGFPLSDPTAILEDLQNRMQQDFPALADLTAQTVQCDIQDVDAGLEAYSSPAFYMIPPIDALMQNTIRINVPRPRTELSFTPHSLTRVIRGISTRPSIPPCLRHADAANSQAVLLRRICGGLGVLYRTDFL